MDCEACDVHTWTASTQHRPVAEKGNTGVDKIMVTTCAVGRDTLPWTVNTMQWYKYL